MASITHHLSYHIQIPFICIRTSKDMMQRIRNNKENNIFSRTTKYVQMIQTPNALTNWKVFIEN